MTTPGAWRKEAKDYLRNDATKEFIKALMEKENFTCRDSVYVKSKARMDRGGGSVHVTRWAYPKNKIQYLITSNKIKKL